MDLHSYALAVLHNVTPGDQVYDALDGRLHRLDHIRPDGLVSLLHGNSLDPLPDLRHPSWLTKAHPNAPAVVTAQVQAFKSAR